MTVRATSTSPKSSLTTMKSYLSCSKCRCPFRPSLSFSSVGPSTCPNTVAEELMYVSFPARRTHWSLKISLWQWSSAPSIVFKNYYWWPGWCSYEANYSPLRGSCNPLPSLWQFLQPPGTFGALLLSLAQYFWEIPFIHVIYQLAKTFLFSPLSNSSRNLWFCYPEIQCLDTCQKF